MEEIWKPVPSKPGLMASSWGRVKLPDSVLTMPNGGLKVIKPKPKYGIVTTSKKGARHSYMNHVSSKYGNTKVHQAVCEAFHGPKPFPNAVVRHLDENALNNVPENLMWGTQKENLNDPKFKEYCRSRVGESNPYIIGRARMAAES